MTRSLSRRALLPLTCGVLALGGCGGASALTASSTCGDYAKSSPDAQATAIVQLSQHGSPGEQPAGLVKANVDVFCAEARAMTLGDAVHHAAGGPGASTPAPTVAAPAAAGAPGTSVAAAATTESAATPAQTAGPGETGTSTSGVPYYMLPRDSMDAVFDAKGLVLSDLPAGFMDNPLTGEINLGLGLSNRAVPAAGCQASWLQLIAPRNQPFVVRNFTRRAPDGRPQSLREYLVDDRGGWVYLTGMQAIGDCTDYPNALIPYRVTTSAATLPTVGDESEAWTVTYHSSAALPQRSMLLIARSGHYVVTLQAPDRDAMLVAARAAIAALKR